MHVCEHFSFVTLLPVLSLEMGQVGEFTQRVKITWVLTVKSP